MRDFDWFDELYCVVKEDGNFAGKPCTDFDEAVELRNQHEGSKIYMMTYDNANFEDWEYGDDCDNDMGFDPYIGCYSDDC